ncbi:MAG: AAA family ATPase [Bacilli bacterium]|nr:AAA family ATPase [Bacilli bacterium]
MYLKKIIASGFKSFADKTVIDLTDGVTGVVGPNGSGKSNVVDAIRWVLGEQSVKSLRGDGNMTDVIFSGSKSRKPQNVATVALIFDNKDKYLKIDYDEVAIKRRLYKDGTNEYLINEEKCRLKDVIDLFLDTGIAKESFNIISQGKVSEIILNKPLERRVIFEEAAGVLKYKKRKEEALRKLDKTNDNLNRVNDIISELEIQVNPLKEQRNKALIFQEKNNELEKIEIALIASDITNLNYTYKTNKEKIEKLNNEILNISSSNNKSEIKQVEYKNNINKLDNIISDLQKELIEKTKQVEQINSEKNILLERKKYEVEDTKLHNNLIELKEKELKYQNDINIVNNEINNSKKEINDLLVEYEKYKDYIIKSKENKTKLEMILTNDVRKKTELENKIKYLTESIENNSILPSSVKAILNNPKLSGIHNVIGNLIEVEEKYSQSITVALGASSSYVVVDDENKAKEAINYLKNNNIGRATFFPLNIIKSRYIDQDTLDLLKKQIGFIDKASNLIKYDNKYKNIIENQLGNIIVVDNIDNANEIGRQIKNTYKIVTLDGELLHVGGSITGGKNSNNKNIITEKYELENNIKNLQSIIEEIKEIENKINDNDYAYKSLEDKLYLINKDKIELEEYINNKNNLLIEINDNLEKILQETSGVNGILNNNLSQEEEKLIENYYKVLDQKNMIESKLELNKKRRTELNFELEEYEFSYKQENNLFAQKSKELKELEIEVNRTDVKLDTLLNKLNETYNLTYEKASTEYELYMEEDKARSKVNELKKIIKDLGIINLASIEEYERVSERYEFLLSQKEDLTKAEDILLKIIDEMDYIMIDAFKETFKTIKEHFKDTFKELFKGGYADLKLTDPDNILETGIEIVASPPGKSLRSITLLSGGEMTLTAISLLFSILKSRPVPFCVLDEVEAALDEVNVDSFGEYLDKFKEKTQFILITHKKKTMEYADILYGITMQESGVSKLVSVKLEEIK